MKFELTKEYLAALSGSLRANNEVEVLDQIEAVHAADIADILNELDLEEGSYLYTLLDEEKAATVLVELDEDVREKFLASLSTKEIAEHIDNLESDDAADVIHELPEQIQEEVLAKIEDVEQASDIVDLLNYEEGTAGAVMAKEFISVKEDWSVLKCTKEMRKQAEELDYIYAVYVTDEANRLLGTISLKRMLLTPAKTKITDIYRSDVISVRATAPSEEVSNIMEKYDLVVLPVVDEINRLIGRITIDDAVDLIKEEAEKDYQMASGISEDVESSDTVWALTRARLPWLLIGMLGGILGAKVIGIFDIQENYEMAFFIPLIAAMGGNVGVQSAAIVVQGLAGNSLGMDSLFVKLIKELGVALINGVVCAIIILIAGVLLGYEPQLCYTVSVSLVCVIVFAALFGTFVPIMLDKYKIDPALATGPFITTVNDVLGLFVYFLIGRLMYFH